MSARLLGVRDWKQKAREAHYQARELARIYGVSISSLEHFFREYAGLAPKTWLDNLRFERADEMLGQGFTVKEAAAATSFSSISNFSRFYKARCGIPPSRGRKRPPPGPFYDF